jgi:hypothetical protein
MIVQLLPSEIEILCKQDPSSRNDGGFQNYLVQLRKRLNISTGEIDLTEDDLERILRYAFDYGNGGWEGILIGAFGRALGDNLGRPR